MDEHVVQSVEYSPSPRGAEPNTPECSACPAGSISADRVQVGKRDTAIMLSLN